MPFTLKVSKGAGAGAEFPFDSAEARLGRTADNDIVVKDAGASRSHCRVFQKAGRFYVEDLKSANGTKLNNSVVTGVKELRSGDTITIGEVAFTFTGVDATMMAPVGNDTVLKSPLDTADTGESSEPSTDRTADFPPVDLNQTVLKAPLPNRSAPDVERERRTTTRRPSRELSDSQTSPPMRALEAGSDITGAETVPPQRALAKKDVDAMLQPVDGGTLEVKVPPALARRHAQAGVDETDDELTAADRLRARRNANKSAMGRLKYGFGQMSKPARTVTAGVGALMVLGIVGLGLWAVLPQGKKSRGAEPGELQGGAPTIEDSFGLGEGVSFERPDMKIFRFTAAGATRIVGVLHYQARDVSKDEVTVSLNGTDLGFVPPDTLDTANRELELVLPAQQIKKGDANQLLFDNVKNPPGDEPWRIWNLWLELIAIPDMGPEELVAAVKEDLERSTRFFDQRDIGPDNLFKAWKGFREAWLKMESLPARPEELYIVARSQQREMAQLLDKRCSMMLLDYQKVMSAKKADRKRGREIAEDMLRYFPTREHRCNGLARSLLEDLGM
ncbi:MAG: FHA domain-containing protein [Archangiaceae bacterium]|nr:FHA domain-containing protein [Archangiaceae bacterium]